MPIQLEAWVRSLIEDKQSIAVRERTLIGTLRKVLGGIGYVIVERGRSLRRPAGVKVRNGRKTLRCEQCGRRFLYPFHLGRHTSAMHATATRRGRKAAKKPMRKAVKRSGQRMAAKKVVAKAEKKAA
jgi:uncharacterized C2H2 Zn-finger protein